LIWPSLTESLGIPILDAVYANKDIIASDLEYINDLLDLPEDRKFDPNDVNSIARTIQKYLENNGGQSSPPKLRFKIFNSGEFVEKLMSLKRV
jgi:glycosyltransferase involved in cell wall biosynthesis